VASGPDPLALPSETDAHFLLLIVSVIGASVLLYGIQFNQVPALWQAKLAEEVRCTQLAAQARPEQTFEASIERQDIASRCQQPMFLRQAGWQLTGCVVLVAVTLGLYWWLPSRTVRRNGFRRLKEGEAADLVARVAELSRQAGLRRPPTLVWNPLNRSTGGVAFGHWGERYLGLYGGTYLRLRRAPELGEAVLLHELAHIRNADLDKAALAVTVWWAFLGVAVLPTVVAILVGGVSNPLVTIGFGWRLLTLAGLVVCARAAVLRSRELYADRRAADWAGQGTALTRALESLAEATSHSWLRLPAAVRRGLAVHPLPAERLAALREPARLLRARSWPLVGVGVATTVAVEGVSALISAAMPTDHGQLSEVLAFVVFAPLAAGALVVAIWRDHLRGAPVGGSAAWLGLVMGVGVWLGWHVSLVSSAIEVSPNVLTGAPRATFEVAFAVLAVSSLTIFGAWIGVGARAWLPIGRPASGSTRRVLLASTVAAAVVLVPWLAFVTFSARSGLAGLGGLDQATVEPYLAAFGIPVGLSPSLMVLVMVFLTSAVLLTMFPPAVVVLAVLWAFPLAAGWARQARDDGQRRLRPRAIGVASLIAGGLAAPLTVLLALAAGAAGTAFGLLIAGALLCAACQAAAGLMVTRRTTWLPAVQGFCAVHLSGGVTSALLLGAGDAVGLEVPLPLVASLWTGGTLLASPFFFGVLAIRSRLGSSGLALRPPSPARL
jgi:Zn-dependent protease with chaperone function